MISTIEHNLQSFNSLLKMFNIINYNININNFKIISFILFLYLAYKNHISINL